MKDKGTTFVAIIAAALIALYFLRDKLFEVVTVKVGGQASSAGTFCSPDYVPVSLGVAPDWAHVAVTQVRFFVDPSTGCIYEGGTARVFGFIRYVTLSDPSQIARFLNFNGAPPTTTKRLVLGPPICDPRAGGILSGGCGLPGTTNPCPDGAKMETGPDGNPVCVQYV